MNGINQVLVCVLAIGGFACSSATNPVENVITLNEFTLKAADVLEFADTVVARDLEVYPSLWNDTVRSVYGASGAQVLTLSSGVSYSMVNNTLVGNLGQERVTLASFSARSGAVLATWKYPLLNDQGVIVAYATNTITCSNPDTVITLPAGRFRVSKSTNVSEVFGNRMFQGVSFYSPEYGEVSCSEVFYDPGPGGRPVRSTFFSRTLLSISKK